MTQRGIERVLAAVLVVVSLGILAAIIWGWP